MMFGEASLSRRLLLGAGVFIAGALLIAAVIIFFVLHRFVQGQIDQRLDTQIVFLSSMLRADASGLLSLAGSAEGPPFDRPRRGWYWQIAGPANVLRSRSLGAEQLSPPDISGRRPLPPPRDGDDDGSSRGARPSPADGPGPDAHALHFRIQKVMVSGIAATIVASAPRAAVLGPLWEAMTTLAVSLVALGVALVLAMMLQVRLGLRPLERLRAAVADVRAGRVQSVPAKQPFEVAPLVLELNGLLEQNAATLERARRHVANLAHGLKTPLATLAVALPKSVCRSDDLLESDPPHRAVDLRGLVDLMDRRIRHHLGRARAAALEGPVRARTLIAPRIADLAAVLAKVNAEKDVALTSDIPAAAVVACEQQDFDEMVGNLLENAFRWAAGAVDIQACPKDGMMIVAIEDDGPGLRPDQIPDMLRPGRRLDESALGFGFGLSIAQELAEMYGGSIELGRSPMGGLRAALILPLAA